MSQFAIETPKIPGFHNTFFVGGNLIRKQNLETKADPSRGKVGGKVWGLSMDVAGLGQTFQIFIDPKDEPTIKAFGRLETGQLVTVKGEFRQMMGQVKTCGVEIFDAKGASLMKC